MKEREDIVDRWIMSFIPGNWLVNDGLDAGMK
jgi:hypothetical protein